MSRRMARTGGPGQQEVAHSRTDLSAGPQPQWVLANRSEWQIALSGLINHQPLISVFNTRTRPRLCHSPMLSPLSRPPAWCGQEVAPRGSALPPAARVWPVFCHSRVLASIRSWLPVA